MKEFILIKDDKGNDALFMIDGDGYKWSVPMIVGNADYDDYLASLQP
jgi:hypothetical protein